MANAPVIVIGISVRDRDDNVSKSTFYVLWATPIADAWALAYGLADRMSALSNGVVSRIELVYRFKPDSVPDAPEGSTIERKVLLLMTNDEGEIYGLVVPSPADIFETVGTYAGYRIDLTNSAVIAFADMLSDFELRTDDNRAVGTILTTGGLAI